MDSLGTFLGALLVDGIALLDSCLECFLEVDFIGLRFSKFLASTYKKFFGEILFIFICPYLVFIENYYSNFGGEFTYESL